MDNIRYSTTVNDVNFSFEISTDDYDLSSVSKLFPDFISEIFCFLRGAYVEDED